MSPALSALPRRAEPAGQHRHRTVVFRPGQRLVEEDQQCRAGDRQQADVDVVGPEIQLVDGTDDHAGCVCTEEEVEEGDDHARGEEGNFSNAGSCQCHHEFSSTRLNFDRDHEGLRMLEKVGC